MRFPLTVICTLFGSFFVGDNPLQFSHMWLFCLLGCVWFPLWTWRKQCLFLLCPCIPVLITLTLYTFLANFSYFLIVSCVVGCTDTICHMVKENVVLENACVVFEARWNEVMCCMCNVLSHEMIDCLCSDATSFTDVCKLLCLFIRSTCPAYSSSWEIKCGIGFGKIKFTLNPNPTYFIPESFTTQVKWSNLLTCFHRPDVWVDSKYPCFANRSLSSLFVRIPLWGSP